MLTTADETIGVVNFVVTIWIDECIDEWAAGHVVRRYHQNVMTSGCCRSL